MAASAPSSHDLLRDASFSPRSNGSSSSSFDAPSASSILSAPSIDPSSLHPLAGIRENSQLDYLLLEDDKTSAVQGGKSVLPNRGWGDELCYGTGSTYLAGLTGGGLWGLSEGLRRPLARSAASVPIGQMAGVAPVGTAPLAATAASATGGGAAAAAPGAAPTAGPSPATAAARAAAASAQSVGFRLRWNAILNSVTRRGSFAGNNAGVLALIYNGFNSSIDSYRGGVHDIYGSMSAGALTGALWRSTAGVKPMIVTSGLMTAGAAGWTVVKPYLL